MRRIPINESEKNRILSLHDNQNINDANFLSEELKSIKKLMKLNESVLITESVNPKEFFESIPFLKSLTIGADEEFLTKTLSQLDELSPTLKKLNITNIEGLVKYARNQLESIKKITVSEVDNDILAVKKFFDLNKSIVKEIQDSLLVKVIQEIKDKTNEVLYNFTDQIRVIGGDQEDNLTIIGQRAANNTETNITNNPDKLEQALKNIDTFIENIKETKLEIQRKLESITDKVKQKDPVYLEMEKTYRRYKSELDILENGLLKQKSQVENIIKAIDDIKNKSSKIIYKGKEYDTAKLNPFQKALFNINIDALGVLFNSVARLLVRVMSFRIYNPLRTQLVENIAKLKELSNNIAITPTDQLTREFQIYIRNTNSIIEQLSGKYFNMDYIGTVDDRTLLNKLFKGAFTGYDTDVAVVWKEILTILKNEVEKGNLTDAQANDILNKILEVAGSKMEGKFVGVNDLSNLEGIIKFKYDLETLAKEFDYEGLPQTFNAALAKEGKGTIMDDYVLKPLRKTFNELGGDMGSTVKKFFKGLAGVFFRELLIGLPFNLRSYLKPIAKYGANLKSVALVALRLSIAKAIGAVVFGGIDAMSKYLTLKYFSSEGKMLDENQITALAWKDYNNEMSKYRGLNLGEIITEIIPDFDWDSEYGTNEISGRDYIEKQNAEVGFMDINIVSVVVETYSLIWGGSLPTRKELDIYLAEQEAKIGKVTNDVVNEKIENYQTLYYSFTPEEQRNASDKQWWYNGFKNGTVAGKGLSPQVRTLVTERFFMKMETYQGKGLLSLVDKNSTEKNKEVAISKISLDKIKTSYGKLENYTGYPCVCKKPLSYDVNFVKMGNSDKTVEVKVPICNDYVRLIKYNDVNISDFQKRGMDNITGFTWVMKLGKVRTNQWEPTINIGKYIK